MNFLIIVLDVGNTNVVIGFYDGDNLISTGRIATDKLKTGVVCDMRRSKMVENIISFIDDGVIGIDDLSEFSDNLKETVHLMLAF